MIPIDKLCYHSALRYENAGEKFAFAVITLCICVISRSTAVALAVLALTAALNVGAGKLSVGRYLKLLSIPLAFLMLSTLAILFQIRKDALDLFALRLGSWYLTASTETFFYGVQLILTALAAVSCLYFLSLNTPMPDILEVLRRLHCPKLLMELMLLIYRFIFVLLATADAIAISQNCRLGNKDYKTSMQSFSLLGSVLLIRAISRAKKLYIAMEARCYDGTIRVLSEDRPPKLRTAAAIAAIETGLVLLALWR